MSHTMKFLCVAVFSVAAVSGSAHAQSMSEILDCRMVTDDLERLRCFDEASRLAAEAIASAESKDDEPPQIVAAAESNAAPDADESFGAADLEQRKRAKEKEKKDKSSSMRAKLVGLRFTNSGRYIITLDNGQVWRQIQGDSEELRLPSVTGAGVPIIIREALFGSHKLRTEASKRTIRVERIK